MTTTTREVYKRIWQTAFDRGSVELHYPTQKEAKRMRLNLYSGVQSYRKNLTLDPDFSAMLERLEITEHHWKADGDKPETFVVRIGLCTLNPVLVEAARQLGIMMEPGADEATDSQKRLASMMNPTDDPYGDFR